MLVDRDAAHVVMRDRRDLDRPFREIDAVLREPIDDRPEGSVERVARHMLKGEIHPAMRRAAPGSYLPLDRMGRDVARCRVASALVTSIIGEKFAAGAVEQAAAELVAKRVPHDRVHADKTR